jgi:Response regulator receiver domain
MFRPRDTKVYKSRGSRAGGYCDSGIWMTTVLIVEDQPQTLALAQSLLEEEGYKTVSAATADSALAVLAGAEAVDILLVDIILSGDMQAGIELAKHAVEPWPQSDLLDRADPNRPHKKVAPAWVNYS